MIVAKDILGEWNGVSLADDLFEFELHLRRRGGFELRDTENEELVMGQFSVEFVHGIYYFILNSTTELFVFQWDGKGELKNNSFIFNRSKKQDSFLFY